MTDDTPFHEFLERVRAKDEAAVGELVKKYEPAILREARVQFSVHGMVRGYGASDICQDVLVTFCERAAKQQFELTTPAQLQALLRTMVRNKVVNLVRKRRLLSVVQELNGREQETDIRSPSPPVLEALADRDLLEQIRGRFSHEEWQLVELRVLQELSWEEI